MMTNRVSYGKPDAGKPHVRFDEGEVASATPRRGSLLYKYVSKLVRWCVCALMVCAIGRIAQAEETVVYPNWTNIVDEANAKAQNIEITGSGTAWAITNDADIVYINTTLAKKVCVLNGGKLILDNVTQGFREDLIYSRVDSRGTVVKRGTSRWIHREYNLQFDGEFTIENGVVETQNWYLMDGKDHNLLNIRSGGTMHYNSTCSWGNDYKVHIAGRGYQDMGAIRVDESFGKGTISDLTLDDDTYLVINKDGNMISGNDTSVNKAKGGSNLCNFPCWIDLAGHTLTIGGTSANLAFYAVIFTNSSEQAASVVFEPRNGGADERLITLQGKTKLGDNITFRLPENARIKIDGMTEAIESEIAGSRTDLIVKHETPTEIYFDTSTYKAGDVIDLMVSAGTVTLSGTETMTLSNVAVGATAKAEAPAVLRFDGAVASWTNSVLTVGDTGAWTVVKGTLIVTNSTLYSTHWADGFYEGHLLVGQDRPGILEIQEGAAITSKVYVGCGIKSPSNGEGTGAVYQNGGGLYPISEGANTYLASCIGIAGSGCGFYQLERGTFEMVGANKQFAIGGYGRGVALQLGGTFTCGGNLTLGANNGGFGTFAVLGGAAKAYRLRMGSAAGAGDPASGHCTVAGPTASLTLTDTSAPYVWLGTSGYLNKKGILNLNHGGTITMSHFQQEGDNDQYTVKYPMVLNANGGVIRAALTKDSIFGTTAARHVSRVALYEEGLTIDTNGKDTSTRYAPMEAAGAGGVAAITLAEPIANCTAPNVVIASSGAGYGATAIPLFDTQTHTVTNILVTSKGWGYAADTTTVKLYDGRAEKHAFAASEITIADNEAGGFTKTGAGTLGLYNANAWRTWTKVTGGTLKVMEAGAIPNGTALTLSDGATLDFNNLAAATFTEVSGTGGTVANGALKLTGTEGTLSISAARYVQQETTRIAGTIDLSEIATVQITDGALLEDEPTGNWRYLLQGSALVKPAADVTIAGVPNGWKAVLTTTGLKLRKPQGTTIFVR